MSEASRRTYTDEERASIVEGYQRWEGSQHAYARACGIPQATLAAWLRAGAHGGPSSPPKLLEVVAGPPREEAPAYSVTRVRFEGVELELTSLPPARWIAELVAELRRC